MPLFRCLSAIFAELLISYHVALIRKLKNVQKMVCARAKRSRPALHATQAGRARIAWGAPHFLFNALDCFFWNYLFPCNTVGFVCFAKPPALGAQEGALNPKLVLLGGGRNLVKR